MNVYPEMQSDLDFCLDTIKAFCASNLILKRPVTNSETGFEMATVCVEGGLCIFSQGKTNVQLCLSWVSDNDLGAGMAGGQRAGICTCGSWNPRADIGRIERFGL